MTVKDVGWNFKNKQIIQNYNNWLSKDDSKEIHWANLKRQYLHYYDYWKIVLEGKTLSEDEMKNKGTAWKLTATSATTEKKGPEQRKLSLSMHEKLRLMHAKTTNWKFNWRL